MNRLLAFPAAAAVLAFALTGLGAHQEGAIGVGRQAPPARDQAAAPPAMGTATISGTVLSDEAAPRPVARALVDASGGGVTMRRQAITTETGTFEFVNLPAGRYTLSVTKPGFVRTYHGARPGHRQGVAIAVTDGQRVSDVTIRMPPGAVITGRVTTDSGQAVERVSVYFLERRAGGGIAAHRSEMPARYSDDQGVYRGYGLRAGRYLVLAATSSTQLGALLPTTSGQGAWLLGNGRGVPPDAGAARVFAPVYFPGTTDAGAATEVTVRAGEERSGVDFPLSLVVTSRVSGTLTRADGAALTGAQLFALSAATPPNLGNYSLVGMSVPRATVSADGTFTFGAMPPGRYTLAARASSGRTQAPAGGAAGGPPSPDLWASADLVVSGADISGVSMILQPGMRMSGRVAFDGTTPPPASSELAKGTIGLRTPPTPGPTIRPPSGSIQPDGSFSIASVAPGIYDMWGYVPGATVDRRTWELKSIVAGGRDLLDHPVTVQPGPDIDDVLVTFTDRVSELSGVVLDQAGRPAPELWMLVFSVDPAHWRPEARRVPSPVRPSSDGQYRISGLPPGDYYLSAIGDFDPDEYATREFLEQIVPGAIRITIGEGEQKVQDIKLGI